MIVPIARFESVLYNAETYEGLRLPGGSNLATLLGSYLSTLTDSVMTRNDNTPFDAIDVTLELLGAAFRAQRRSSTIAPRDQLFARISDDIEARLNDLNLSPTRIAEANGISIRYLYTLFSEQGETVSGWVRRRRLLRCRAELDGAVIETPPIGDLGHGGLGIIPPISADCSKPLSVCRRHNIGLRGGWAHPTSNCVPCGFVSPDSRGGNRRRLVVCDAAMRVSGRSRWGDPVSRRI